MENSRRKNKLGPGTASNLVCSVLAFLTETLSYQGTILSGFSFFLDTVINTLCLCPCNWAEYLVNGKSMANLRVWKSYSNTHGLLKINTSFAATPLRYFRSKLIRLFGALRLFLDLSCELWTHMRMRERQHRFPENRRLHLHLWFKRGHLTATAQVHIREFRHNFRCRTRWKRRP